MTVIFVQIVVTLVLVGVLARQKTAESSAKRSVGRRDRDAEARNEQRDAARQALAGPTVQQPAAGHLQTR